MAPRMTIPFFWGIFGGRLVNFPALPRPLLAAGAFPRSSGGLYFPALRPIRALTLLPFLWFCDFKFAWLPPGHHFIYFSTFLYIHFLYLHPKSQLILALSLRATELFRAQFSLFSAFPSVSHSPAPLETLERRVSDNSGALYEVTCHAEARTTGNAPSRLPEPKAARAVWAVPTRRSNPAHQR